MDDAFDHFVGFLSRDIDQNDAALEAISEALGDAVVAVYLYGSSVEGGLQPASDVDLFVVVDRELTAEERQALVDLTSPISSRSRRPKRWRPLEITVARTADLKPWRYPARVELQLGEWMRADLDAGHLPGPHESADLCVLVSQLIDGARILFGPEPAALVARPPDADVRRAIVESVPLLLDDLETDTANVLLTLARMAFTLETGKFAPKDVAADWAITRWQTDDTAALERARDVYLGEHRDEWADLLVETRATAERLTNEIRHHAER